MKSFTMAVMAAATAQACAPISPQAARMVDLVNPDENDNNFLVMKSLIKGPPAPQYDPKVPLRSLLKDPESSISYKAPTFPKTAASPYTNKELFKEVTTGK